MQPLIDACGFSHHSLCCAAFGFCCDAMRSADADAEDVEHWLAEDVGTFSYLSAIFLSE